ncbi:MAG: sugar phosphate isomerase/epimerase [Lachnospiraceae bacterium]|nr:sugar phosphate isomerase/epimerase [Lachnospiraceae bacterium]
MQLGIRLHDTKNLPIEERIAEVHAMGFQCGHLTLGKVITEFSTEDAALTPGLAMYLKKIFEKNQVDIAVLGCYLNLAHPDPRQLEEIANRYLAHIRFASWLGCGVVGTETGAPNADYAFVPECHSDAALNLFIDRLRPVVRYAEQMGVVVGIEPVWRHIVYNPARARQVLDTLASPNLQIILDPANLLDYCNYRQQAEVVEEAIDLLGDDVAMIHIKDFIPEDGSLKYVGAGLGMMDYTALMKFIREKKPFIHATLEDTTPENQIQCRDYILARYAETAERQM